MYEPIDRLLERESRPLVYLYPAGILTDLLASAVV